MRKLCSTMLFAGFLSVAACGGSYNGGPTDPGGKNCGANTVCMLPSAFSPTSLTVSPNTTVTFDNTSLADHNIVFDAPVPPAVTDIGLVHYGDVATRVFGPAGTYNFHCTIHLGMNGKVIVQ